MRKNQKYSENTMRALATQRTRKSKGLCIECGEPSVDAWRCDKHKKANAIRVRNIYRIRMGIPLDRPVKKMRSNI